MLTKKLFLPFLMLILLPGYAISQTEEIKDYKVIKGDTLWDISGKELNDPFLWPKVWKENPDVKNPDRIYPSQTIKIPLYLLQKEQKEEAPPQPAVAEAVPEPVKVEEPKPMPPPKPKYLVDKSLLISAGYITDSDSALGEITGSPSGRNLFGNNDLVFVRTAAPVSIGDKFYIVQKKGYEKERAALIHPVTKKMMGYVVDVRGIAEIVKFEYGQTIAKITTAFKEIAVTNILDTYFEMTPPLVSKTYRKPEVDGYVVATNNLRLLNGMYDVVYIDRGRADGLEPGDLIRVLDIKEQVMIKQKHKAPIGTIQIIHAKDSTATAVVRNSSDPITIGNLLTKEE